MPCLTCGAPSRGKTRCPAHTVTKTAARGYGARYRRVRDAALEGATRCANCGQPFTADNPATGGHVVALRDGGTLADGIAPHCARCNYGWAKTGL